MPLRTLLAVVPLLAPAAALAAGAAAHAALRNADGQEVGTARFSPAKGGVRVQVAVSGLSPGLHGIHIHAAGKCDGPDFKSAGGHFNPGGKKHGLNSAEGAHAGDLPNLVVAKGGKARGSFVAKGATLGDGDGSLFGPDGTALVIHAGQDDEKTDPAGNSGDRIACGVIEKG